jgi:hypothetical protein
LREIWWPIKEYQVRLRLVLSVVHENQEANAVEVLKPGRMTAGSGDRAHSESYVYSIAN